MGGVPGLRSRGGIRSQVWGGTWSQVLGGVPVSGLGGEYLVSGLGGGTQSQ